MKITISVVCGSALTAIVFIRLASCVIKLLSKLCSMSLMSVAFAHHHTRGLTELQADYLGLATLLDCELPTNFGSSSSSSSSHATAATIRTTGERSHEWPPEMAGKKQLTFWQRGLRKARAGAVDAQQQNRTATVNGWWMWYVLRVRRGQQKKLLVGMVGFAGRSRKPALGYAIVPSAQGVGYATEAVRALIRWAFEHPSTEVEAVVADTLAENRPAVKLLDRLGFQRVGQH